MDKKFQEEGYTIFKGFLDQKIVEFLKASIDSQIGRCAKDLNYSKEKYLSVVSRWVDPSPVTSEIQTEWVATLASKLSDWAGEETFLNKMNIICKNPYCTGEIPLHQDISYSPGSPYQFTTWIALDDVDEHSSPLSVVPKSHLGGIFPAVDFWSPQCPPSNKKTAKIPIQKGDAICFDSRLWHGSPKSDTHSSRYAWVLRWSTKSWKLEEEIPPFNPLPFGMWTCGEETKKLLSQNIKNPSDDLADLIALHPPCPILEKVKILHLASLKHNGGDATGTIYKELYDNRFKK